MRVFTAVVSSGEHCVRVVNVDPELCTGSPCRVVFLPTLAERGMRREWTWDGPCVLG